MHTTITETISLIWIDKCYKILHATNNDYQKLKMYYRYTNKLLIYKYIMLLLLLCMLIILCKPIIVLLHLTTYFHICKYGAG